MKQFQKGFHSFLLRGFNAKCAIVLAVITLLCFCMKYYFFQERYASRIIYQNEPKGSHSNVTNRPRIANNRSVVRKLLLGSTLYYSVHFWRDCGISRLFTDQVVTFSHGFSCQLARHPKEADAIIFYGVDITDKAFSWFANFRTPRQRWIFFALEPVPYVPIPPAPWAQQINWTVTYKQNADIRMIFPGSIHRKRSRVCPQRTQPGRSRRLAFGVMSNCFMRYRIQVAQRLQKINSTVDLFGKCGNSGALPGTYGDLLKVTENYYFYLAFENNFCTQYISEKFFNTGLLGHAVPVVLGALSKSEYEKVAPKNSFIFANDFDSVQQLGTELQRLANNPSEYNKYHEWRCDYTVSPYQLYTDLESELCYKLHTDTKPKTINFTDVWNAAVDCRPQKLPSLN